MDVKKTITTIFMVPTLGIDKDTIKANGFMNGYCKDGNRDVQYENCIYILFKPTDLDKFRDFLDGEYERTKSLIDDYDYDGGFIVIVYELDKKFKKDFTLVKKGLYSKTSPEFQAKFSKIVKIKRIGLQKDEISLQYRVFNKTEDLRKYWEDKFDMEFDEEWEVWDGFDLDKETLLIDKIKQDA
jgi:hypothetical protein